MTPTSRPKREDSTTDDEHRASTKRSTRSRPTTPGFRRLGASIDELHRLSAVYTTPSAAARILDAAGWRNDADLTRLRLLEPAAGTGEFVVQAAQRLVASCRRLRIKPTHQVLRARIRAYELHLPTALDARRRLTASLCAAGVNADVALACATEWIHNADFLLSPTTKSDYTHVVGNPPYLRWSRVPPPLKFLYEKHLPSQTARGDIFLPFLDRAFELLRPGGKCGFLCSDRWLYMAFGHKFRKKWLPWLDILSNEPALPTEVFHRQVGVYPTILIASKRAKQRPFAPAMSSGSGRTLAELGYTIKVGPALGHTPAFVLQPGEDDVERELLQPWLPASDIRDGAIYWSGRRVLILFAADGTLLDLCTYPRLASRLRRFAAPLTGRAIVRNGSPWYRTIDRIRPQDWTRPKLLIPELAKTPRVALDRSGAVPSHGVYAIFAPRDRLDLLHERLQDGGLARALEPIAPRVQQTYVRCYKRFLLRLRL